MLVFDTLVATLAPHACLGCQGLGTMLCDNCIVSYFESIPSRCAGCRKLTDGYKTCTSCRSWLPLKQVLVCSNYEGVSEALISAIKFGNARAGVLPVATIMSSLMEDVGTKWLLCPIPTAPARIRLRGFDHAKLLSREIHKLTRLGERQFLRRVTNSRQVGASRSVRIDQARQTFEIINNREINGKDILLIDDVMTTGATLSAAAQLIKQAGAKSVSALVFAQKV